VVLQREVTGYSLYPQRGIYAREFSPDIARIIGAVSEIR
jgi:hypothetical protein